MYNLDPMPRSKYTMVVNLSGKLPDSECLQTICNITARTLFGVDSIGTTLNWSTAGISLEARLAAADAYYQDAPKGKAEVTLSDAGYFIPVRLFFDPFPVDQDSLEDIIAASVRQPGKSTVKTAGDFVGMTLEEALDRKPAGLYLNVLHRTIRMPNEATVVVDRGKIIFACVNTIASKP